MSPLADVARSLPDDPWAATVEAWEGPVICAADADEFSARDWRRNALSAAATWCRRAASAPSSRAGWREGLDIRLHTPVTRIRGAAGGGHGGNRERHAHRAVCIVTVSTGVLGAGRSAFDPALPAATPGRDRTPCRWGWR